MIHFPLHTICSILEHDDSLTDREEGGILDTNFKATKRLWLDVYNADYVVQGGMYRGEPPNIFYNPQWVVNGAGKEQHLSCDDHSHLLNTLLRTDNYHIYPHQGNNGASSVGRDDEARLTWLSIDSPEAFKPMHPKSTSYGVNANEKEPMYVFGDGGMSKVEVYSN